jgi:hypothetical protein
MMRLIGSLLTGMVLTATLVGTAAASPAIRIPLWHDGQLVTGLLLRGAEPGQPGFNPLPAAQAASSNDTLYVITNNPNQSGSVEVIAHVPSDPEYTGGRWNVVFVEFNDTIPEADRPNVTSVAQIEALALAGAVDLLEPGVSFVCPVVSLSFDG